MENKNQEIDFEALRKELQAAVNETYTPEELEQMRSDAILARDHSEVPPKPKAKRAETGNDAPASSDAEKSADIEAQDGEGAQTAESGAEAPAPEGPSAGGQNVADASETGDPSGKTEEVPEEEIAPAFDKDAITKAVMVSSEIAAEETEKQVLDEAFEEKRRARRRTAGKFGIGLAVLFVVACAALFAYHKYRVNFYTTHFFNGATVNGRDVSGMTAAEVKATLFGVRDDYTLTILEREGLTEQITSQMLGRSYIDNNQVEEALASQDADHWYSVKDSDKNYEVSFSMAYDEALAEEVVNNLACLKGPNIVAPSDARLTTDINGNYIILPETEGNMCDAAKVKEVVLRAIDEGVSEVDLEAENCYLAPAVLSTDAALNKRMNSWNAFLSVDVTYSFGPNTEVVDSNTVRPYITDNGYDVYVATDWIRTLVYGWGQKYDTFGLERTFMTHDGVTIRIPAGGDYGWVIDKEKMIDDVIECINTGATGNREAIWLYEAMGWDNGDITGTYVEVSIPEQHLWCYKDGELVVDTDVVTGLPTEARETKPGCFAIDGKKENATLGTLDVQGYASPVGWWLPFNGGQGLHDAPWRGYFGGTAYLTNGSHGCVNVPVEKMEQIFNTMEIGMAVVVYNDKTPVEHYTPTDVG